MRIEFQARGSPHAHTILWIKDALKLGIDSDEDVCSFIDQYISCSTPEVADLAQLVSKAQALSYFQEKWSLQIPLLASSKFSDSECS